MRRSVYALTVVVAFYLVSCSNDPKKEVEHYITDLNKYDDAIMKKRLDKTFTIKNNPFRVNKEIKVDSFKSIGGRINLISIIERKGVIKTTENWTSLYDSLLEINSKVIFHNMYEFKEGKIKSITVEKVENFAQYKKEYQSRSKAFESYLTTEYSNLNELQSKNQLVDLLTKYSQLPNSTKKQYTVMAYLNDGEFTGRYAFVPMRLKFKGKSTVFVSAMGINVGTTYTIDDDYIHVKPIDNSYPMTLYVRDENTMSCQSLMGEMIFTRRKSR